jgi:hypothetical protein
MWLTKATESGKENTCSEIERFVEDDCGGVDVSSWVGEDKRSSNGCGGARGEDVGNACLSGRGRGSTE